MTTSLNKVYLPDGEYKGIAYGLRTRINFNGDYYEFQITKTMSASVTIIIKSFKATVS